MSLRNAGPSLCISSENIERAAIEARAPHGREQIDRLVAGSASPSAASAAAPTM